MIDFDSPTIARDVERLAERKIHRLPFGAIRLDDEGRVQFYSDAEARLSGFGNRPVLGRVFFTEIAPCMDNDGFLGRVRAAQLSGKLDLEFGWFGDFEDRNRHLRVRVQSAVGGYWIFLKREMP
jgi:photoactive yellow protein